MAGVTPTGFVSKTVEELQLEIGQDQLTTVSPALNLDPDQPVGQVNGIVAKKLAELWEVAQVCYNAVNPNSAEGPQLDNLGLLTGTPRLAARRSLVTMNVTLGASFSQPAGVMIVNVAGQPTVQFTNKNTVTSTTAGVYTALFQATVDGPVVANAGTLTVITTPVSGWTVANNLLDATRGSFIEDDTAYRLRRSQELSASGSGTPDGMRADILAVPGVQEVFINENLTDLPVNGLPPHSFEVTLYDGSTPTASNSVILQTIWNNKPSGVLAFGTTTGTAVDSQGVNRTLAFSRVALVPVWLVFDQVLIDSTLFPPDGVQQIINAATAKAAAIQRLGTDVIALQYRAAALSVLGVIDVSVLFLGTAPAPVTTANLSISSHQKATVDSSHVTVNTLIPTAT